MVHIIIGVLIAGVTYLFLRALTNHCISRYYVTDELKAERRETYLSELQRYANEEGLSSFDTDKIALWAKENPYLYILVYKDEELFFSSDMNDSDSDGEKDDGDQDAGSGALGSGGDSDGDFLKPGSPSYDSLLSMVIGSKVDKEALIAEAEKSGTRPIQLKDGLVFAAVAEFSEELYYDLSNFSSLAVGILMLGVVLILYFRQIVARIKRLESDVNIVSHINMNHAILCEGEDEISVLSRNVENMRNTILENLEKEREARSANTELVTAMSHDIRTPLTVLLGYIDILKNYEGNDETVKSYVLATEKTALRLKELSDDMFKYSLAFGEPESETELMEYDAKMLFEQLLSEHILLLSENGYKVNMDNNLENLDDKTTVYTDPQNLMRVIDNIFQNIYKYADKEKSVDISMIKDKEEIVFFFKNGVSNETCGAESNGIGLKTCSRLCRFIAGDFNYRRIGDDFIVRLSLKLGKLNKKQKNNNKSEL